MGIMDDVTGALSRGTNAAERAARSTKLKADLRDVNKRRQGLAAQLGASLYEVTRENGEFRKGREELYEGIAQCDGERDEIQRALDQLQEAAAAEEVARQSFACCVCGAMLRGGDLFCSGCGTPADKARQVQPATMSATAGLKCAACGASLKADYVFCMECGAPVQAYSDALTSTEADDGASQEAEAIGAQPCCPTCGASVEDGQAFCMECGTALVKPESA